MRFFTVQRAHVQRLVAVFAGHLADNLVLLAVADKVAVALPAQAGLQGLADVLHAHAQALGLFAVNVDAQLGLVELQVHVHEGKVGSCLGRSRNLGTAARSFSKSWV